MEGELTKPPHVLDNGLENECDDKGEWTYSLNDRGKISIHISDEDYIIQSLGFPIFITMQI